MKTEGRPRSKNVKDFSNVTWNGRFNQFVDESLTRGATSNTEPKQRLGKQGTRKISTGRKTGGGF